MFYSSGNRKKSRTHDHVKVPAHTGHGIKDQKLTDLEIKGNNNRLYTESADVLLGFLQVTGLRKRPWRKTVPKFSIAGDERLSI